MLRALGHTELMRYHMNEGHAALLTLELLEEEAKHAGRTSIKGEDIEQVRSKCVFTTHTPVPAGHDKFPVEFLIRPIPTLRFFDAKDPASVDLLKSMLQSEQTFRLGGSGKARGFAEHDLFGTEPERLHQWRGEIARRSFTANVSEHSD